MSLEEQALTEMEAFLDQVDERLKRLAEIRRQTLKEMRKWLNARKA